MLLIQQNQTSIPASFFDYIYVPGGNQYKLLSKIREYEIDKKIIIPCLEKGAAYIGISAGAYVAAQDMRYCLLLEPNDNYPLDDYTALGLVDFNVIPTSIAIYPNM